VYANRSRSTLLSWLNHFSYSTEPSDLTKSVSYGRNGSPAARDVYDYGEAVRLLKQALKVQEVLDLGDKGKRYDLLTILGRNLKEMTFNTP